MLPPPDRRVLLRWIFLSLGLLLIFGANFIVQSVLRIDSWAALLFPPPTPWVAFLTAVAHLGVIAAGLFCLATASGLKRCRSWSRHTGVVASVMLLFGFPWLTIVGVAGLYVLLRKPLRFETGDDPISSGAALPTKDFWDHRRRSKAQQVVGGVAGVSALLCLLWFETYARRAGLPPWHPGLLWFVWFFAFSFINTSIHEFGHALMAKLVGYRFRVICVGPFTFWNDGYGYQFRFESARLLDESGYAGAVPLTDRHLRIKQIAVVAAGPAASFFTGLIMLLAFRALPGSHWESWWWVTAFTSVLGFCHALGSLVPIGYSDGTMLLHLIGGTRKGRLLLTRLRITQLDEEAEHYHDRADFERVLELREIALGRALAAGEENAAVIALCHQALGSAKLNLEDWPGAEIQFRKCLDHATECAANPAMAANAWSGLQKTCGRRHHVAEAARVYASAVALIESRKRNRNRTGFAVSATMLAEVHLRAGSFQKALDEVERALAVLPDNRDRLMLRAHLHALQGQCQLYLWGRLSSQQHAAEPARLSQALDDGLATIARAAGIYRSDEIPLGRRNLAWEEIGELGEELWRAGQSATAIELWRESIEQLEARGVMAAAARNRIKLASALRGLGQQGEAWSALPREGVCSPVLRRALLTERAQLHLIAGRPRDAAADCRALLALWGAESPDRGPEMAAAEALLAHACLEAGDTKQADMLASHAAVVLVLWQHPDAAGCLITQSLARWQATGEWTPVSIEEVFRSVEAAPLLTSAEKTRILEAEVARIDRHVRQEEPPAKPEAAWHPMRSFLSH